MSGARHGIWLGGLRHHWSNIFYPISSESWISVVNDQASLLIPPHIQKSPIRRDEAQPAKHQYMFSAHYISPSPSVQRQSSLRSLVYCRQGHRLLPEFDLRGCWNLIGDIQYSAWIFLRLLRTLSYIQAWVQLPKQYLELSIRAPRLLQFSSEWSSQSIASSLSWLLPMLSFLLLARLTPVPDHHFAMVLLKAIAMRRSVRSYQVIYTSLAAAPLPLECAPDTVDCSSRAPCASCLERTWLLPSTSCGPMTVPNAESWHTTTVASSRQTMSRAVIKVSLFHMYTEPGSCVCRSSSYIYYLLNFPCSLLCSPCFASSVAFHA